MFLFDKLILFYFGGLCFVFGQRRGMEGINVVIARYNLFILFLSFILRCINLWQLNFLVYIPFRLIVSNYLASYFNSIFFHFKCLILNNSIDLCCIFYQNTNSIELFIVGIGGSRFGASVANNCGHFFCVNDDKYSQPNECSNLYFID